ncbi:hypothetical protein CP965_09700 [Halarcobacter mediterraneus]|uniref:RDD domain-containing protein n=1 Tax=Halarcobacter mediterraneus TaxID=2023153 RepID=A0A4Q1AUD9_9BACT|nr:RDD family protein [Halarcobacter mediterraneus]RXK12837.1 hypothetical protein CP965_09700 [Halarcobacter mediterraneus]
MANRWRDIKQGNIKENLSSNKEEINDNPFASAPIGHRIKAFIVDMFMIMMPIMYITTYLIMDGKDDFQGSDEARWITALVFGLIIVLFWIAKGQTPGLKAYSLKLIDDNTKNKISLPKAIIRYLVFLISATTIILAFLPFFRKDKKTFQDLLTKSTVIQTEK